MSSKPEPITDPRAEVALDRELEARPGVQFTLGGVEYELPRPFPMSIWIRLFRAVFEDAKDTQDDQAWFAIQIAARAEDVVCWATRLDKDVVRGCADYDRVMDDVATQLGGELADAGPFSEPGRALATLRRVGRFGAAMAKATASAGGAGSSPSSVKSAEATGTQ